MSTYIPHMNSMQSTVQPEILYTYISHLLSEHNKNVSKESQHYDVIMR